MGSPGTFSLSPKKSQSIKDLLAPDPSKTPQGEAAEFFKKIFADKDWKGLFLGEEWQSFARLLVTRVAEAQVRKEELESWLKNQKVDLDARLPLIQLGDRWLEKLDRDLSERDVFAFELAKNALRRTLEDLYSPNKSPFDVRKGDLLKRLKAVDAEPAFKAYLESYLNQVTHYIMEGYQPEDPVENRRRQNFIRVVERQQIPKLADQILRSLREYSLEKGGGGKAVSLILKDVPEWLDITRRILIGEIKK
jgi:hypothetical protein